MRRHYFFFFLVYFLFVWSCKTVPFAFEEEGPVALSDEERWMDYICSSSHMGRKVGTKGCDSVAVYILHELEGMGYKVYEQPFRLKDSLDIRNLYVVVNGESDSIIVVGAHYDGAKSGSQYHAADDNGSGVVTLLSMCKHYSDTANKPHKTLVAGFWTAEEVTIGAAFNGSSYFVKTFDSLDMVKYYCNLDTFGRKDQGAYFFYSPGFERAGTLMSGLLSDTFINGLDVSIKENDEHNSDYMPFYRAGIPYIGWIDYDYSNFIHSAKDTVENISFEKISAIVELTTLLLNRL